MKKLHQISDMFFNLQKPAISTEVTTNQIKDFQIEEVQINTKKDGSRNQLTVGLFDERGLNS